jgi:3-hydroxymyristoyl/3-hydroxydecanoyl-(acyl carrier protein) dehydratase
VDDFDKVIKRGRKKPIFTATETTLEVSIGRDDIEKMLPHRPPMLFVDHISRVDLETETMRAHRRIDPDDPLFVGHFPGQPVYPGALLLESVGQAALCLHHLLLKGRAEVHAGDTPAPVRLLKVHHTVYMKEALPGDELELHVRRLGEDGYTMTCAGQAIKNGEICALAILEVYMVEEE